ncbi:MAG: carbohydrate ABC transporter permease [Ruminococcus sp.]
MTKVQAKAKEKAPKKKQTLGMKILTVVFSVISVFYVMPIVIVVMNSFKTNAGISSELFALPNADTFYGFKSYITGMFYGNFPFYKTILCSLFITVGGVFLILFCTSMCAWYLSRSNSIICKIIYYFCIFSMVVPFQMVMFTLSKTADTLNLTTPWGILIIYLGFGAGLAVFMFTGFVKSIPIEIEEAADVDGAGPIRTFFSVVLPIMKPTFISVGILETMWIWNDYLLPYLILDKGKYKTIPIHIQYLNGSYGHTDTSAIMALIVLSIVPIVIFYFSCQKYIIEGVVAGAVKG